MATLANATDEQPKVVGNVPDGIDLAKILQMVAAEIEKNSAASVLYAVRFEQAEDDAMAKGAGEIALDATVGSANKSDNHPPPRAKVISAVIELDGGKPLSVSLPFYR